MSGRRVGFAMALGAALVGAACGSGGGLVPADAGGDAASSSSGASSGSSSSGATSSGGSASSSSGSGSGPVDDSGSTGPSTDTYFLMTARLQGACSGRSCLCLPQTLPVDAAGQTSCRIFLELASGDTCAAHGLSAAAPDVVASIVRSQGGPQTGAICVLPQVPSADWVNGSCATSAQAGWCYVTGAAAGGSCAQTILTSPSGAPPSGAVAMLACGDAPASSGSAATSAASVGASCAPSLEHSATFGGFNYREVTVDQGNASCTGGACLVNHFQGLTSCPYGQDQNGNPPPGAPSGCTVTGTSTPVRPNTPVSGGGQNQTVNPWCTDRLASQSVYCSCRCENAEGSTADGASYCTCPTGYSCTQLVPAVWSGDPVAGGYCMKNGTAYNPNSVCSMLCDPQGSPCLGVP